MIKTFPKGGVHPPDNKLSCDQKIVRLPVPEQAIVPLSQHIGAPAKAVVKPMDLVKVGDLLAQNNGFISANIHAPVSGKIMKIDDCIDVSGYKNKSIIIKTEGDSFAEGIDISQDLNEEIRLTPQQITERVASSGIVGLGGATFPSHVKLSVPKGKTCDYLIINAVECEPYLTADHRLMLEKGKEILTGIRIILKALDVSSAIIGIENNKKDAITYLETLTKNVPEISVQALKVQYPQGGEKQLIKALLGREVPAPPGLPIDVGCVVFNVGTVFAIYEAVQKNKPLIERVVTVTGKAVKKPSNFLVRIGTSVQQLMQAAQADMDQAGKIISGGPMMGKALNSLDIPVVKGTSGILVLPWEDSKRAEVENCIRCGRCVTVCPLGLEPYLLSKLSQKAFFERAEDEDIINCIECGCCSYTCPSGRPLLDFIRHGKTTVMNMIKQRGKK